MSLSIIKSALLATTSRIGAASRGIGSAFAATRRMLARGGFETTNDLFRKVGLEAREEITNANKLQSVTLNSRPTIQNTMLGREFKVNMNFRYTVAFDAVSGVNDRPIRTAITVYSDVRLTKQQALDRAQDAVEGVLEGTHDTEMANIAEADNYRLEGAFYNLGGTF